MGTATNRRIPVQLLDTLARQGLPDAELLRRYADGRDEDAFSELVRRHGPLVLRACRHQLGETAAVEDAFQATFLLLARKAERLGVQSSLAGWLHATAVHTARTARRADLRRRRREHAHARPPVAADDRTWREVREALDIALAALPDKYRAPLVLCYLEELSYEEAARQAGCSPGALRGRLERGKVLLRKRLERSGLTTTGPVLLLTRLPGVSAALVQTTLTTIAASLAGRAVPPAVAALVAPLAWLKAAAVTALVLVVALGALWAVAGRPGAEEEKAAAPAPPPAPLANRMDALGDPLPPNAIARLGTRRFQVPTWPLQPVSVAGGKAYLVYQMSVDAAPGELRWMDAHTGKVLETWKVPEGRVPVGISPDGSLAILGDWRPFRTGLRAKGDKPDRSLNVYLYDLATKKQVGALHGELEESAGEHTAIAGGWLSLDGRWLATVHGGSAPQGRVRLWQVTTGKQVWASDVARNLSKPLGFTPGGAELVLQRSNDNTVHVIDTTRGKVVREFPTMPPNESQGAALTPDGSFVLMGTYSPRLRLWDVRTGKERPALVGHREWARRSGFTPDGRTLITGGNDPFLLVRDWPSGDVRGRIELGRGAVQELLISADGKFVDVIFWWEHAVARYSIATGKAVPRPSDTHRAEVLAVAAAPDGSVWSAGVDQVLRRWDVATSRQTAVMHLDAGDASKAVLLTPAGKLIDAGSSLSADGRYHAAPGPEADVVTVWDEKTRKPATKLPAAPGGWWGGVVAAFGPDGRYLATTAAGQVRLWEVDGWRPAGTMPAATSGLAFSPDGRALAVTDLNDVTVWEVATRQVRLRCRAERQVPTRPQFSPDGRFLAWLTANRMVEVWDLLHGRHAATFRGHEGTIRGLTFTSDGRRLVTASNDCTLLVWDVAGAADRLPRPAPPGAKDLEAAWKDLTTEDAERAYAAERALRTAPEEAVRLIRTRLEPARPLEAALLRRLLADLDDDRFEVREEASRKLEALGDRIEGPLRELLAGSPSAEARRRAKELLALVSGAVRSPQRLRQVRAVEVLEWVGTDEARDVLRRLARGDGSAALTRDAAAARDRSERQR